LAAAPSGPLRVVVLMSGQELYNLPGLRFFAAVVPFALALLGTMIANFPISFTNGFLPGPLFGLMPVYFWGLLRPDLMPPWAALLVGLTEDLLSGGAPGIWAVSFIASYIFIDRQRESLAGLASYGAVLGFAAAVLVASGTAFAIVAVYYWRLPPVAPFIVAAAMNVLWYTPALWFMNRVQHHLIGPLRGDF
jgi:rod shape-determining protein MreD